MRGLPGRPHIGPPSVLRDYTLPPEDSPDIHPPDYQPPAATGELAPDGSGHYRSDRPGFTGRVAPDGTVSLKDVPSFSVHIMLPNPVKFAHKVARGLEKWHRDPYAQVRRAVRNPSNMCQVSEDPCVAVEDEDDLTQHQKKVENDGAVILPVIGGAFNPTDAIMRAAGIDPYQSEKLRWMDRTRDERAEIGRAHRAAALEDTDVTVRKHLLALWARTDLDLLAKREALFELWDECAEDGDAALVEAGTRARHAIIGFIRGHAAVGSDAAYTATELTALNGRRTSKLPFAPYP